MNQMIELGKVSTETQAFELGSTPDGSPPRAGVGPCSGLVIIPALEGAGQCLEA